VVIAAGSLSNSFTVDTLDDAIFEGAETFSAQIDTATNPNGPVLTDTGIATGTITDNESAFIVGTNFDDVGPDNDNPHLVNNTPLDSGAIVGGINADILVGDTGGTKTTDATGKNSNIILILDKSGSMQAEISFTDSNGNTDTMSRLNALKLSVDALLTELEGSLANEVRVHIIEFDKTAQSVGTFDLKNPGGLDDAIAAVNGITDTNGSTNYEDALQKAIDWSGTADNLLGDEGGTREVVNQTFFISDGKPRAFNTGDDTSGNDTTKDDDLALGHATGVDDNVSEVATLIAQFGKTEAVGIALQNEEEIDNLNEVEGAPRDSNPDVADNIFTANELIDVLHVLNPLTGLSAVGDDTITGGDGDDFIFGDSLFTDTLAADQGLITDDGSGWQVFAELEEDTARDWDRDDTINYIQANHVEVAAESLLDGAGREGGNDSIDAGAGNDTVYGQEGDDMIIGGAGDDLLSGGTGADTFIWQSDETGTDTITDFDPDAEGDVLDIADLLTGADGLQADELDGAYISISIAEDATVSIYSDGDGATAGTPDQVIELTGYNTTGFTNSADVIDSLLGSDNLVTD
jgi:Ca2+-binding RTX toxin-like protein